MMKYAYGIAALIAFGEATRLADLLNNDDQLAPFEVEEDEDIDDYLTPYEIEEAGPMQGGTEEHPAPNGLAQYSDRSVRWDEPIVLNFYNNNQEVVELFWHDYSGNEVSYGTIAPGGWKGMNTYATHPWSAVGASGAMPIVLGTDASNWRSPIFVPDATHNGKTVFIDNLGYFGPTHW